MKTLAGSMLVSVVATLSLVFVGGGCVAPPEEESEDGASAAVAGPGGVAVVLERSYFSRGLSRALLAVDAPGDYCAYRAYEPMPAHERHLAEPEGSLFLFGTAAGVRECARVVGQGKADVGAAAADALAAKADLVLSYRLLRDGNGSAYFVFANGVEVGELGPERVLSMLCTGTYDAACTFRRDKGGKFSLSLSR